MRENATSAEDTASGSQGNTPQAPPSSVNGVNRCLKCGASDVRLDGTWLVCDYCHYRWDTAVFDTNPPLTQGLQAFTGTAVSDGAEDIDTSDLVTIECTGCGAEICINTASSLSTHCPWCRHVLSINNPVGNGAIPDAILPFLITREDAMNRMWRYVLERATFTTDAFKRDFSSYTIFPIYLPYLVVDGEATVRLDGHAWVRQGQSKSGEVTVYRSDECTVMREADLTVDDLTIEARSARSNVYAAVSTTNIINAILPFDIGNAVRFSAHYIADGVGFEKRDLDVSVAMSYAADHFATIARVYVNQTLTGYTGGVRWEAEQVAVKGTRWVSMLLPVWLYGFQESTTRGPMMHYIVVNGRTGETQGSVPIDTGRAKSKAWRQALLIASLLVPLIVIDLLILGVGAIGSRS